MNAAFRYHIASLELAYWRANLDLPGAHLLVKQWEESVCRALDAMWLEQEKVRGQSSAWSIS